jgi:hypothetical protein
MSIQLLSRGLVVLSLAACVSGCSSSSKSHGSECSWYRSSCIYKGAYEPGEKDYAEDQAQRLNAAEYERLRKSSK